MPVAAEPGLVFVVVPCGQSKVWDREPDLGPVLAAEAYADASFAVNRLSSASLLRS